jgi:hypothetical protein
MKAINGQCIICKCTGELTGIGSFARCCTACGETLVNRDASRLSEGGEGKKMTFLDRERAARERHPDCIVLMHTSRGYRAIGETALTLSLLLGRPYRERADLKVFFIKTLPQYGEAIDVLIRHGFHVVVCE